MIAKRIGLGVLALIIGGVGVFIFSVVSLIAVSGYTDSLFLTLAFVVVTLFYALVAYRLRLIDYGWSHIYALLMCTPLLLLGVMMGLFAQPREMVWPLGALLMTSITVAASMRPLGAHAGTGKASR